ncbi:MAG: glycosyltransferase [Vicinamibacterales bacterium]
MVSELFVRNLAALEARSPKAAAIIRLVSDLPSPHVTATVAATGDPVLESGGRALDSRRDPRAAARRTLGGLPEGPVVLAGFGTGYVAEAMVEAGVPLAAVVEPDPAVLAAAMRARDLTTVFAGPVVWCLESLLDRVELLSVRAVAPSMVPHGPSVQGSPELRRLLAEWPGLPVARRAPRVLVAGPIYGGSLEVARATARAVSLTSAETRLFDFSVFAGGHHELGALGIPQGPRAALQAEFADVLGRALVEIAREWRADLVIALAQAPLGEDALGRLRALGIPSAFWFVENHRVLGYWTHVARHYDWFYGIQPGRFLEQLAAAGAPRPGYLPMACDPGVHAPVALSEADRRTYGSDVSFAGAPYLNRRRMLVGLADLDFRIWGDGWNEPALAHLVAGGGRRFDVAEMVKIFGASAINLNLHSANHVSGLDPEPDFVNPRTFEIAACGAFQLVDRRDPLPALFAADEMVAFGSMAELRAQIARYLADPAERQAVAGRARARVLAEHTYEHRVRRILRDALPSHLAAAALTGIETETLDTALLARERSGQPMDEDEALMRIVFEVEKNWGMR